ncbi:MAG TPA: RDD family protein [candidate division Zixibacteria bacterium]|nr:RDD family protein [candidate division Zixibacteria bacterium]MDD4917010.1 RDD family protein [candidate division Zixibacteria bacterium]MDM7972599.1 RDD family protein [candidate division Zixibacteria bacterium]HOD66157.1 RDD family protein [candidate division Zixibacteria bacterium]HPI32575.1 RDD family protein [candidate division Zixibacteria bacterium]
MQKSEQPGRFRYAGLGRRFAALMLDFALGSLVFFPVTKIAKGVWILRPEEHAWRYGWLITDPLCLMFLAVILAYFILSEGLLGATLGKRLVAIRVVRVNGERPGLGRSLIRNVLRAVDALPAFNILGIVLIVSSPEKARAGDRVAGTRVIALR